MRELFFKDEKWELTGDGDFTGTFHLFKARHRDLAGTFTSDVAGVNDYRFPSLYGSLRWTPARVRRLERRARSSTAATRAFAYSIKPLGAEDAADAPLRRDADRTSTSRASPISSSCPGCGSPAAASLHNVLEWPSAGSPSIAASGQLVVDAAARRDADDARRSPRRAAADAESRARTSGVRSRRRRCRRTCRSPAS